MSEHVVNLGGRPPENAGRDAVHVAVVPCVAGEELWAGYRVIRAKSGRFVRAFIEDEVGLNVLGVVDPFLRGPVLENQRFWLFLLPDTITSLRHVWTHPSFVAKPPVKEKPDE
jgi:hypothetical protein